MIVVQMTMGIDPGQAEQVMDGVPKEQLEGFDLGQIIFEFRSMNWSLILPVFVLFFLGGYFIYSSLFAAIGSAISDDMGESQSLMLPIMLPVIFAFIMMPAVLENPNGSLAVFGSMFPLFSPVLMPVRLAFDPPLWQVLISLLLLIGTAVLFVWISSRIYRVGILMYGKKVNFKELGKWLLYRS
jgi:ABC-2 type transport system permease protein